MKGNKFGTHMIMHCFAGGLNTYGVDWNGPLAVSRNDDDYVPYIQSPLPDGVLHDLQETVHPLDQSSKHVSVAIC